MKKYKIWRFAYTSHEETVTLPDDLKLYSYNKQSSIEYFNKEKAAGSKCKYPNQTWLGICKYSKDTWKQCSSYNVLSLDIFNLCDQYIIFYFEQICPISTDWPETDVVPSIDEPHYVKLRALKVEVDTNKLSQRILELEKSGLSDKEQNKILKEEFQPIIAYIKIHGVLGYGALDCTNIICASSFDGSPVHKIERRTEDFKTILAAFHFERTEFSNKDEFDAQYDMKVKAIYNN